MYIVPDSKVYVLKGIPITNNYHDTLFFQTIGAQYNYFYSQSTPELRFDDYSYIRVNENKIRVGLDANILYNANYLMFQNTSFGNKWFYAFVTNVEYVNNACTEITFEIDRIQTWWFDVQLRPSLVMRQHAVDDGLYVNCEPENFQDFALYTHYESNLLNDATLSFKYITITNGHFTNNDTNPTNWVWATQGVVNNMYTTLETRVWENNTQGISDMRAYLNAIISGGREDDIIAVYAGPKVTSVSFLPENVGMETVSIPKTTLNANAFQGYVPKNNKLYNFPFCKLVLEKGGSSQDYAIEDFRTGTTSSQASNVQFKYAHIVVPGPQVLAFPVNYRGAVDDYNAGMDISEFSQAPIQGDTFKMWLAQHGFGDVMTTLGDLTNWGISSFRGSDFVGSKIDRRSLVQDVARIAGDALNQTMMPRNVHGLTKPSILTNLGEQTFWLKAKSLNYWQARQIDDYFTMYGYRENHVFVPNIHARQRWTYVQTADCKLVGYAPSDDLAFIADCFNSGITWWVNPSEVGRYDLANPTL